MPIAMMGKMWQHVSIEVLVEPISYMNLFIC